MRDAPIVRSNPHGCAFATLYKVFSPVTILPVQSTLALSAITEALTAIVYPAMEVVANIMAFLYSLNMDTILTNPLTVRLPVLTMYFITGSNRSPSSIRISLKCFLALSSSA